MAKEDQGLVLRGLILLTLIGVLVAGVLTILFWRTQAPEAPLEQPAEFFVPSVVLPGAGGFPSSIAWLAMYEMTRTMPSAPGFDVRYNAAVTLARRGSPKTPWPLIREMLDERQQRCNNRVRHPDGREVIDEANVREIMIAAMRAVATWHEKQTDKTEVSAELREIYSTIDTLSQSPFGDLKIQADKTRAKFFR